MLPAISWLLLAAVMPQPGCAPNVDLALAELNVARLASGAAPLRAHPALCETAVERVAEVIAGAGTAQGVAAINQRTNALYRRHYAAHAWSEAALIGGGAEPVIEQFRQVRPEWHAEALGGNFEEVGAAAGRLRSRPVYAILLALPRSSVEWRQAAPLRDLVAVRRAMLATTNRLREQRGLTPVAASAELDLAAQAHAEDMLRRAYYDHQSPEGESPRQRVGAAGFERSGVVSENIAKGPFTASEVVERWMNSSGHRRNIVRPKNRLMGAGVAFGDNAKGFEVIWVQLFAGD